MKPQREGMIWQVLGLLVAIVAKMTEIACRVGYASPNLKISSACHEWRLGHRHFRRLCFFVGDHAAYGRSHRQVSTLGQRSGRAARSVKWPWSGRFQGDCLGG
jgi:hypothetical protein